MLQTNYYQKFTTVHHLYGVDNGDLISSFLFATVADTLFATSSNNACAIMNK